MAKRSGRRRKTKSTGVRPGSSPARGRPAVRSSQVHGPRGQPPQSARPLVTGPISYLVEPVFPPSDPRSKLTTGPIGSPGIYRVTFVLAIPGLDVVQEQVDFARPDADGDSLLLAPEGAHEIRIDLANSVESQAMVIHLNEHRRLRSISLEIRAASFLDARRQGHDFVVPFLSKWSFLHDVAITTSGVRIEELATGTQSIEVTMLGAVKAFSDSGGESTPEHRVLLAAYREGISSAEPLWQALSLYKVAEGVWAIRAQRRKAMEEAGQPIYELSERVPQDITNLGHPSQHDVLSSSLTPYAGKKFRAVFDNIRATLRNSIAHIDPDGDPLAQDSWEDIQRIHDAIPALRWMSRHLLEVEIGGTDET